MINFQNEMIEIISSILPNFNHIETKRNLDSKCNMYKIFKRFFDLISSLILLLIISPVLILICLILRFTAEGEVFFLQERIGQNNSVFKYLSLLLCLKIALK